MVIVARLTLPGFKDGPGLLHCQHPDEAELVAERVLHDRLVDDGYVGEVCSSA